MKNQLTDKFTY